MIVYLRRQDKYLIALWNQRIKVRKDKQTNKTIDEYIDSIGYRRMDYDAKLNHMAEFIGEENITVRRFERKKFEGGTIYSDFLDALGLSMTDEYNVSQEIWNTGLYGNTHELKRILNELPQMKDTSAHNFIMGRLWECSEISAKNYPCEFLSKEEIAEILKLFEEGNKRVAEKYFHEPDAELFDNTIADLPKWEKDNSYMIDDLIRFVGASGIFLYQENQKLREEFNELKKKRESGIRRTLSKVKYLSFRIFRCQ